MGKTDAFLADAARLVDTLRKLEERQRELRVSMLSISAVDTSLDHIQGGPGHDMADDVARLEDNTQRIKALKCDLLVMQGYVKQVDNEHYRYLLYTHGMYGVPLLTISNTIKTPYTTLRRDYAAAKEALCKTLVDWRPSKR